MLNENRVIINPVTQKNYSLVIDKKYVGGIMRNILGSNVAHIE